MFKNVNRSYFNTLALLICTGLIVSCDGAGVQGTDLYSKFQGFTSAVAVSPTTVELAWGLDSKYTEYRIYQNDDVAPIKKETFGTTKISNLDAGVTYYFQISGYSSSDGEKFFGGKEAVTTFSHFNGLTAGGVVSKSISEVKLSWTMNSPTTKFKIYHKLQSGTWDLNVPTAVLTNANQYTVPGLSAGQTYCFYIRAEYVDGTFEPAATTQGDINSLAKCQLMTASMPSLPSVNVSSVTFGDFPWFWTSSGDSSYKTDIYDLATDNLVASRTGNGYFRSSISLPQMNKNFYALVSNTTGNVSRVDVAVSSNNSNITTTAVRKINSTGTKGPIYPPILANGFGTQNLGSQVVQGDFNCDGLPDFAVAAPVAVPFSTPEHYAGIGAVMVYYTYAYVENDANGSPVQKYAIKNDVAPSATALAPNPQLITYPVTGNNMNLGNKLAVGNFNGDCVQKNYDPNNPNGSPERGNCDYIYTHFTTPTAALIRNTKKCDDLVIGSKGGYFYVVYGDPNIGLVSGSMSNSSGADEQTCDAVSSTCRTSKYNVPTGYATTSFGRAIAVGDFNNDGFDDIALSATANSTNIDDILIYRGDSLGTVPYGNSKSFPNIRPNNSVGLSYVALNNTTDQSPDAADGFGFSLTAVPNARLCKNNIPAGAKFRAQFGNYNVSGNPNLNQSQKGLDVSKCADLVIGAPSRPHTIGSGASAIYNTGSIYACRSAQSTVATDKQQIISWNCEEHWPQMDSSSQLISQYGYSVLGVANQNGYPIADNLATGNVGAYLNTANVWGALFVGAPGSTIQGNSQAGSVYGYYITESNGNGTSTANPGIQSVFTTTLGGSPTVGASAHVVTKDNDVPCDQANIVCGIQRLFVSPAQGGMQFGTSLSSINERAGSADAWMPILAVGAPYRNNATSNGVTQYQGGALYLFRGDISTFMNAIDGVGGSAKTITSPFYNPSNVTVPCSSNCTWLSGGVSPYGATIVYNTDLPNYSFFGLSGAVGFSSLADQSFNNDKETDFITSAPNNSNPTNSNGGVYGFFSTAGSFSPTVSTPNFSLTTNVSLEGNYQFEEAQVIGDLNGDGYQDVMAHINNNGNWVLVVYYGSANGLIQTPAPSYTAVGTQPKLIRSLSDTKMGEQFYRAGDLNGDGYADIIALSSNNLGTYIYYGSSSGLVAGVEPSISPIGKNPLRFAVPGGLTTVTFTPGNTNFAASGLPIVPHYNNQVQAVTYGKFNGDIYDDIAIRVLTTQTLPSPFAGVNYTGLGRVYIIYGSASGPKTNNITGKILLQDTSGNMADVVTDNPCDAVDNSNCKIQMLASPDAPTTAGTGGFGYSIARRNLYSLQSGDEDGLLISNPIYQNQKGIVYVYQGAARGLNPVPIQRLLPRDNSTAFGYTIVDTGDINGDRINDIAVSAYYRNAGTSTRAQVVTIFYGKVIQSKSAYGGALEGTLAGTNFWSQLSPPQTITDNQFSADSSSVFDFRPQVINPISSLSTDSFGFGMTAVGDLNQDGFNDLVINIPNGDYRLSGNVAQTGYALVFFGSDKGLQTDVSKVTPTPYPRCYKGPTPICDPYQIYLPNFEQNDFTHLNPNSSGDINGDGIPDIVFGASGRSHPSGKGISTGVIYVLY